MSDTLCTTADLRTRAASRLAGDATGHRPLASAVDALSVLHRMAATARTAADALALLHELQVHQVEIDLQAEAMKETQHTLELELAALQGRFAQMPVGCITFDAQRVVVDLNPAAARLLGPDATGLAGRSLDAVLPPGVSTWLQAAMADLDAGRLPTGRPVQGQATTARQGAILLHLGNDAGAPGTRYLLCLTPSGPTDA